MLVNYLDVQLVSVSWNWASEQIFSICLLFVCVFQIVDFVLSCFVAVS